jgi:hypothetical protein
VAIGWWFDDWPTRVSGPLRPGEEKRGEMRAVRVAGLVKTFGRVVAVNGLSFEAPEASSLKEGS